MLSEDIKDFEVSLKNIMSERILLNNETMVKADISTILEGIDSLEYSDYELQQCLDIYLELLNTLRGNKEVEGYLKNAKDLKFSEDEYLPNTKNLAITEIDKIETQILEFYDKLNDNIYVQGAPKDSEKRQDYYTVLKKGFRFLSEIIKEKENLDAIELIGNLVLVANLNNICVFGWKDTLLDLVTIHQDDIRKKVGDRINITDEKDEIKRTINRLFFESRMKVAKDMSYNYLKRENVTEALRPYYEEIFNRYFNKEYDLQIPTMKLENSHERRDSRIYNGLMEEFILRDFKEYLTDMPIEDLIIEDVSNKYRQILQRDNKQLQYAIGWGEKYFKDNNLKGIAGNDEVEFLDKYIFNVDLDTGTTTMRKQAIEKMLVDMEYIKKDKRVYQGDLKNDVKKALSYCENDNEFNAVKKEIKEIMDKKEISRYDIFCGTYKFDGFKKTEDILIEIIKRPMDGKFKAEILGFCASTDNVEMLKRLKNEGFGMSKTNMEKMLLQASKEGNIEMVKFLLKMGTDVNVRDIKEQTPLTYAVKNNKDTKTIDVLLNNGADINVVDKSGNTLLWHACENGNTKIAAFLLKNGINTKAKNPEGRTAMYSACLNQNLDMINLLLNNGNKISEIDNAGISLLIDSIKNYRTDTIEILLNKGVNINIADNDGKTALMYALETQSSKVVKMLIDNGAKMDLEDKEGNTILEYTINNICKETVEVLIKKGFNVNLEDKNGRTLLSKAIEKEDLELMEYLVENGADMGKGRKLFKDIIKNKLNTKQGKTYYYTKLIGKDILNIKKWAKEKKFKELKCVLEKNPSIAYRRIALESLLNNEKGINVTNRLKQDTMVTSIINELQICDEENCEQWAKNTKNEKIIKAFKYTSKPTKTTRGEINAAKTRREQLLKMTRGYVEKNSKSNELQL